MRRRGLGKGLGKGYKNLVIRDPMVHSLSAKGVKTAYKLQLYDSEGEIVQERYFSTKMKALNEIKKIEREIFTKIPEEDYEIDEIKIEAKGEKIAPQPKWELLVAEYEDKLRDYGEDQRVFDWVKKVNKGDKRLMAYHYRDILRNYGEFDKR